MGGRVGGRVGGRGGARGLGGALVDAERHHEAFVVVRVLADQVDAAGRLRERGRERESSGRRVRAVGVRRGDQFVCDEYTGRVVRPGGKGVAGSSPGVV